MPLEYEQLLINYFNKKPIDFLALNKEDQKNVFNISLSYPDLFSQISPFIDKNYFYDEEIQRGDFGYYPHRFLIMKENASWFVEHCSLLSNSFFIYSNWYHDDEYNLEVSSEYMLASKRNEYYNLLDEECRLAFSKKDFMSIVENMIDACIARNFIPENTEGIEEVITENLILNNEEKKDLFEKLQVLQKKPSSQCKI